MTVFPNVARKQAHLHFNVSSPLTHASLISLEGRQHSLELFPHDHHHYLVRWRNDLPAGMYQLCVRTRDGQRMQRNLRIA